MTPNRWAGVRMLQTAHRLNERCFSLLAETVRTRGASVELHVMYGLRELWAQVDARVCERSQRWALPGIAAGSELSARGLVETGMPRR